ncbi:hypothetical protein N7450_011729 [Penicillium hetheringtonii]|uniref:Uncharacterized protein n=1 Tax=Penicillium hetheringtonii TaxID=911720 RepID=A0AAD6DAU3_9EURO|nr:hypothetical protein N7450_011729 [Penicillium hetheringtonii]
MPHRSPRIHLAESTLGSHGFRWGGRPALCGNAKISYFNVDQPPQRPAKGALARYWVCHDVRKWSLPQTLLDWHKRRSFSVEKKIRIFLLTLPGHKALERLLQGHLRYQESPQGHLRDQESPQGQLRNQESPQGHLRDQESPQGQLRNQESPQGHLRNQVSQGDAALPIETRRRVLRQQVLPRSNEPCDCNVCSFWPPVAPRSSSRSSGGKQAPLRGVRD